MAVSATCQGRFRLQFIVDESNRSSCFSKGAAPGSLGRRPAKTTAGASTAAAKKTSNEAIASMIAKSRTGTIEVTTSDPKPAAVVRLAQNTAGPAVISV